MAVESYNEETQRAKVGAGIKGPGPYFRNPITHPPMTFVDGIAPEVRAKMWFATIPSIPVIDTWPGRKG